MIFFLGLLMNYFLLNTKHTEERKMREKEEKGEEEKKKEREGKT